MKKQRKLTEKQKRVLLYIRDYAAENGYPPTEREIARGLGMSSHTTAYSHIHALEDKGYVTAKPMTPRSVTLTEKGWAACGMDDRREDAQGTRSRTAEEHF